jgi:MFS family permease
MTTAVEESSALGQPRAIESGTLGLPTVIDLAARKHAWTGFAVVLTAMIMNLLDSTIVNVAAPSIQRNLGMSSSALEWIAAAYTLAIAVGLMTGGRLGDMFGRKRMLMTGLAGFVIASAACAMAWSPSSLIVARVLQGLSAAVLTPQAFGLIRDLFPPAQMTKAFAALGPVIGLSTVAGPIVAGLLLKANLFGADWRTLFLINLPLGVFALVVGGRVLPARAAEHGRVRLDGVGTGCWRWPASCWSSRSWTEGRWAGPSGSSACPPRRSRRSACSSRTSVTGYGPGAPRWSSSACCGSGPTSPASPSCWSSSPASWGSP